MTPAEQTRYWRKGLRRAMRGTPTGRRVTHEVLTTYGRHQKERDRLATWQWVTAQAEMAAAMADREQVSA